MNADMLSRRLIRKGWEVLFADNGRVGIESARAEMPDVILMDLSLPEIDGWTATRTLKGDPLTAGIPIIVLSAHAMQTDRDHAFEAGCDEFQTKPVDFPRLSAAIEGLTAAQPRQRAAEGPEEQCR
jgi:CheY-like chemotaxis protein